MRCWRLASLEEAWVLNMTLRFWLWHVLILVLDFWDLTKKILERCRKRDFALRPSLDFSFLGLLHVKPSTFNEKKHHLLCYLIETLKTCTLEEAWVLNMRLGSWLWHVSILCFDLWDLTNNPRKRQKDRLCIASLFRYLILRPFHWKCLVLHAKETLLRLFMMARYHGTQLILTWGI